MMTDDMFLLNFQTKSLGLVLLVPDLCSNLSSKLATQLHKVEPKSDLIETVESKG